MVRNNHQGEGPGNGDDDHRSDMTNPESDPFHPPSIPTLVHCLHCDEEYDSFLMEYHVEQLDSGKKMGFWCCPSEGCDGKGFGFDILPVDDDWVDPDGRDMGWEEVDQTDDEGPFDDESEDWWGPNDDDDEDIPF